MIIVQFKGVDKTTKRLDDLKTNTKITANKFPLMIAKIVRKNIRKVIDSKSYSRHPRHGPYRRASGKGVGNALQAVKTSPNSAVVRVEPALAGGTGPQEYVLAMEYGGSGTGSRPTYYIREGIRKGLAEYKTKQKNKNV